jgi:hypothetical protein
LREKIIGTAVDEVSRAVLDALARGDAPTPEALRLLLRGYAATGRDEFRDALESGLAGALEIAADSSSESAPPWLILFAEAAEASDDERLREAAANLASKVRMMWGATRSIGLSAASVDACLRANLELQGAIDELERVVGAAYEPGEGIDGTPHDEIAVAGTLLTAFLVTGRLPYAMLAEELVQHARRPLLSAADLPFDLGCHASAVLSRMAVLHQDEDYRTAAVIAPGADYAADAAGLLERLAAGAAGQGLAGAAYGLAAGELQSAIPHDA